ncbi:DNA topoisomerase IV subunit A [Paraliomyxa miuraensis]|uniref:DNA topoisomerase IV subunit A n=1 Tax=Paraliomyxa miuraensis TaxID=376150 RepID=UPI00225BC066|nr:DNA topoisomerase IV subunit A [Paraliomyxa miuraensis]MCX4240801.1 DNA topoisomerase IV subunit A [Paraliomyxa miuraensis]
MTQLELLPPALSQGTAPVVSPEAPGATATPEGGSGDREIRGDLAEEARRKYLNYALSVITARAIPDVRDGLKPVARRILFTMWHELRLVYDGRHRKSAKVVGDVIGKYHPHGDSAVYDAMVRLAQDFVMRAPLVDGHGNFGSIDGDAPAAYRYTEARLSEISSQLLEELGKDTVEFRDTFDGTGREPVVLPARFPQLLVNGGTGIAVGMATAIPPHNLGEVIRASTALLDQPELTVKQLMKSVRGPDFPTGGELVGSRADLLAIYESGRGSFKLRGRWKQVESKQGPTLVITEIPYGVEKAALCEEIGQIILSKKLPALIGVQDLSTRETYVELQLDRKSTVDPELIMAYLFKHSRLQVSVKVDLTVLVPTDNPEVGAPARLDLRQILQQFLDFRIKTVRRRLEHDLRVLLRRIHILEGFEKIFDALDKAIKIIRASDGKADASTKLCKAFGIDEEQADAVLETKLYRLAKLEIQKIREELADKRAQAKAIRAILKSEAKLRNLVKQELEEVSTRFADSRRTKLGAEDITEEFSAESFIVEEDAVVLLTRDGWIKRQRTINLETTRMREGDEPLALVGGSTRECVVILTNMGSAYVCRINDVPPSTGHGTPVQKLFKFKDGERVVGAVGTDRRVMPEFAEEKPQLGEEYEEPYPHLLAITKQGQSLRFALWAHREPSTSRGRMFARLSEGDEVVAVFKVYVEDVVCALTREGRLLACSAGEVNLLSGAGKGVRFIKLDAGDEVVGAFTADVQVEIEKSTGGTQKLGGSDREPATRGGKGRPVFKRGQVKRLQLPPPAVPDLNPEGEDAEG